MAALDHTEGWTLKATPERIFAALTDAAELRKWLAEDVSIDARPGGAFTLAGRGAYAPTQAKVLSLDPPKAVTFAFPIHGAHGEAAFTMAAAEDDAESQRLTLHHSFPEAPATARPASLVSDLWKLWMGNLKTHVEGGTGILMPDFSDPAPEIRQSIFIAAPRAQVFRTLVEPALLDKWTGGTSKVEPRSGGAYSYGWSYAVDGKQVDGGPTRIIDYVENEKLVTNWPDWRGDTSVPDQRITWLLADEGEGTRLTLIHDGFARAADFSDYPFGWAYFAGAIKGVAEGAD